MTAQNETGVGGTVESERSSYLAEIWRLRQLVILAADELKLIEDWLVPLCQYATDDNSEVRMTLLAVRNLRAKLEESGRPIIEHSAATP